MKFFQIVLVVFTVLICSTSGFAKNTELFNFDSFFGEKVKHGQSISESTEDINLELFLPADHRLLIKAKPKLKIIKEDGQHLQEFEITDTNHSFTLSAQIEGDAMFAHLALFYCHEGDEGMCLISNVLYEIPIDQANGSNSLNFSYTIPEETY